MISGQTALFKTLCSVLDALRNEAPPSSTIYHPSPGNHDAVIQARSRALLHLFLKARFGLISFAAREEFVTDGANDGGIDAYYIDAKTKRIYVLQSKFRATAGNFATTNVTPTDLLHMDVARILKGEKKSEAGAPYNERITKGLQKKLQKLPDAGSYTTHVLLLGNTKNLSSSQIKKLVDGYAVDQFPHDRTYKELLFPVIHGTYFTDPNLTIEIDLTNVVGTTHLDYNVKAHSSKVNIKLLFVPTREVGRIMSTYRNSILKFNPRSFLELEKNAVNQDIAASINSKPGTDFALFNNGISVISDQTAISKDTGKQGTAQLVLRNPQLINGGQTAYTLGRIYDDCAAKNDFSVFKGKEVVLRVITFVGKTNVNLGQRLELIADVSRASNSQTKIEESDRRSNDEIQIKLQSAFFIEQGLYYERKRGEFSDGLRSGYISNDQIVNRERLIRVALSIAHRSNQARSSISKFFDPTSLSKLLHVQDAQRYAYGYSVLRRLESTRRAKPQAKGDRYHTKEYGQALRYGLYAVVSVATNAGMAKAKSADAATSAALKEWPKFEAWASKRAANSAYKVSASFDFVNYYKGPTVDADLKAYPFAKAM